MIVVILGPDAGLARRTLKRVLADRDPSGQSTSWLDGNSVGIPAVIGDISSIGFFSAGRVVVVENLIARLGKQGSKENGNPPNWAGLYAAVPEASTLILIDPSLAELPALAKKPLPSGSIVEHSKPLRGPALIDWMIRTAKDAGGQMDKATAQDLAMTLYPQNWSAEPNNPLYDRPPDMELLQNEVQKLVLAAYPDSVTRDTVRAMTPREEQDQIFTFLDAAGSGNVPVAMQELHKLLAVGEDPAKLLAQRQANAIATDMGAKNPRQVQSMQRNLQGMSPAVAQTRSRIASEADRKFKTGQLKDPLDALYDTILRIARMRQAVAHRR
jgi:DNA polymerase III delta subunit